MVASFLSTAMISGAEVHIAVAYVRTQAEQSMASIASETRQALAQIERSQTRPLPRKRKLRNGKKPLLHQRMRPMQQRLQQRRRQHRRQSGSRHMRRRPRLLVSPTGLPTLAVTSQTGVSTKLHDRKKLQLPVTIHPGASTKLLAARLH